MRRICYVEEEKMDSRVVRCICTVPQCQFLFGNSNAAEKKIRIAVMPLVRPVID